MAQARKVITDTTRLATVPYVPEIRLQQAEDPFTVWEQVESTAAGTEQPPPFWAFAWAGGQALARYLIDHPGDIAGRRVVDFATGSGIVAIAAAKAGAAAVLAADVDPFCAAAVALNAAANGVTVDFTGADLLDAASPAADVILAADICYEQPLAGRVLAWLAAARAAGARVLIGDPGRSYFPKSGLTKLAEYRVPTTRELEDAEVKRTAVWALP
jgi:predicted nicotinamide N-methyase